MDSRARRYADEMAVLRTHYARELPQRGREVVRAAADLSVRPDPQALEELFRLTHRLTGSAAIYGFPGVSEAASALEAYLASLIRSAEALRPAHASRMRSLAAALEAACARDSERCRVTRSPAAS